MYAHRAQVEQQDWHGPVNVQQKTSLSTATKNLKINLDWAHTMAAYLYLMERLLAMPST